MASEEEQRYFQELEAEKREKMRKKLASEAAALEEKRRIAASTGADMSVADRIAALGFTADSARVFDLMPLVHVAWADGAIQKGERSAVLRILESRGIEAGSEAFVTMESMLEQKPDDAFMRESLAVLQQVVGGEAGKTQSVVDLCIEVAAASGGLLGLGRKVSETERKQIEEIVDALGATAVKKVEQSLE